MLGHFPPSLRCYGGTSSQEIQRIENLEVALGTGEQIVAGRLGKSPELIVSRLVRWVNRADGPPGGLTEGAQERAVVAEIEPQSLGNGEHELAVWDLSTDVFGDPAGFLQGPFLVVARAKAPATTGKGHEQLVPTFWAANPCLRSPHSRNFWTTASMISRQKP